MALIRNAPAYQILAMHGRMIQHIFRPDAHTGTSGGKLVHGGEGIEVIDREFVTSAKKFANFNEYFEIKKIRKNSYKNSLKSEWAWPFSGIVYLFK